MTDGARPRPEPATRRRIGPNELSEARAIFRSAINYSNFWIIRGRYFIFQPENVAMAPDGNIYFPPKIYRDDFTITISGMALLLHEMTHVWQVQKGVWLKTRRLLLDFDDYDYVLDPAKNLQDYKVEEQGSIIEDYYLIKNGFTGRHGTGPLADYETIISRAMT